MKNSKRLLAGPYLFWAVSFVIIPLLMIVTITKPIRILDRGMSRVASGDLETRISQQVDDRDDQLSNLALQFDKMAQQLQKLVEKERHLLHHVSHEMRSPLARLSSCCNCHLTRVARSGLRSVAVIERGKSSSQISSGAAGCCCSSPRSAGPLRAKMTGRVASQSQGR